MTKHTPEPREVSRGAIFRQGGSASIATAGPAQATFSEVVDWFERGELPPAGTKCEFCNSGDEWTDWHQAIFVGTDALGNGVVSVIGDDRGVYWHSKDPGDFRPISTERDELVNVFINHYGNPKGAEGYIGIADAILAAGFKRNGGAA